MWKGKCIDTLETNVDITDDYETALLQDKSCIKGRFMGKVEVSAKRFLFKLLGGICWNFELCNNGLFAYLI